jgi:hypothetical protein
VSDLRKSAGGNPPYPDSQTMPAYKAYEQYMDRAITPECLPSVPEFSHKRTTTLANYKDTYAPIPENPINTSIIDKICNYQRIMGINEIY